MQTVLKNKTNNIMVEFQSLVPLIKYYMLSNPKLITVTCNVKMSNVQKSWLWWYRTDNLRGLAGIVEIKCYLRKDDFSPLNTTSYFFYFRSQSYQFKSRHIFLSRNWILYKALDLFMKYSNIRFVYFIKSTLNFVLAVYYYCRKTYNFWYFYHNPSCSIHLGHCSKDIVLR